MFTRLGEHFLTLGAESLKSPTESMMAWLPEHMVVSCQMSLAVVARWKDLCLGLSHDDDSTAAIYDILLTHASDADHAEFGWRWYDYFIYFGFRKTLKILTIRHRGALNLNDMFVSFDCCVNQETQTITMVNFKTQATHIRIVNNSGIRMKDVDIKMLYKSALCLKDLADAGRLEMSAETMKSLDTFIQHGQMALE